MSWISRRYSHQKSIFRSRRVWPFANSRDQAFDNLRSRVARHTLRYAGRLGPCSTTVYSLVNVGPHSWAPSYRSPHQINDIQSSTTFSDQLNPPPAQQVVTISPHPTTPLSESPRQFQIVRPRSIFPDDPPPPQ
ncbi:hypothetical protein H4Q26_006391 [Puccinia striiformis f. sp. tritici PST-130]|nr:hypothetical protein H4Q26_006391 [Puccinia striiformis f. sp. tritici PST-130]